MYVHRTITSSWVTRKHLISSVTRKPTGYALPCPANSNVRKLMWFLTFIVRRISNRGTNGKSGRPKQMFDAISAVAPAPCTSSLTNAPLRPVRGKVLPCQVAVHLSPGKNLPPSLRTSCRTGGMAHAKCGQGQHRNSARPVSARSPKRFWNRRPSCGPALSCACADEAHHKFIAVRASHSTWAACRAYVEPWSRSVQGRFIAWQQEV